MHELDRGFPTESKTENKCVSIEQPPQQIVCNLLVLIQSLFFYNFSFTLGNAHAFEGKKFS